MSNRSNRSSSHGVEEWQGYLSSRALEALGYLVDLTVLTYLSRPVIPGALKWNVQLYSVDQHSRSGKRCASRTELLEIHHGERGVRRLISIVSGLLLKGNHF